MRETEGRILVEISPFDGRWGIALAKEDDRAMDPGQWQGQNRMGVILGEVRDMLIRDGFR